MNKKEFNAEKKAYQQPAMKVVEIDSCDIICTSTEGYGINQHNLDDDDFE